MIGPVPTRRNQTKSDNGGQWRSWSYEPVCFADPAGQYLPDFQLFRPDIGRQVFVEVKPDEARAAEALDRMHVIRSSIPDAVLMVVVPRFDEGPFQVGAGCHFGVSTLLYTGPWACRCSVDIVRDALAADQLTLAGLAAA